MNLLDLIQPHASFRPESQGLLAPGYRPISSRQLWDQINQIGSQFNQLGIGREDRITLVSPERAEMAGAFLDWLVALNYGCHTAVPTVHQAILAWGKLNGYSNGHSSLQFIYSSSAPLPPGVALRLEEVFSVPLSRHTK